MILSVSRRTDIPAFYSEWFFNRLKEGFLYVRNPMNIHQVSKVNLSPDVIDCIVFWSKNPRPMLNRLDELKDYNYYFQFTINPYDRGLEAGVPLKEGIIDTFKKLSDIIGKKRVIWRYDPIFYTDKLDCNYHIRYFEEIAKRLNGYTNTCVISFVDLYKKIQGNLKNTQVRELTTNEMISLAKRLFLIGKTYEISIQTCAEEINLESVGIKHGKCIDDFLIEDLIGKKIIVSKDPNQRKECGCVQSIDVGEYNTCAHGCKYCYANFRDNLVVRNRAIHDPNSPLLVGHLVEGDKLTERKLFSLIREPESYMNGDIVRLKNPDLYKKVSNIHDNHINLYRIKSLNDFNANLYDVDIEVPKNELLPVPVNGVEDRWIFYDPIIMASFIFPGDEIPTHQTNYSYYMKAFESNYDGKKSFKEIVEKEKLVYVHEIQHWLRKRYHDDRLRINEWKFNN